MRPLKNQRGLAAILELFLMVAIVAAIGFVGWRAYQAKQVMPTGRSSQAEMEPEVQKPVDPTEGWKKYASKVGKYSLRHPPGWAEDTCPSDGQDLTLYLGPTKASRVICNSEHGSQVLFTSTPAVPTPSEQTLDSAYFTSVKRKNVKVDGQKGFRQQGKLKAPLFGLPKGTLFVQYFFLLPGRSYIAAYVGAPSGDYKADNLEEFDLMVTDTLKFNL